MTETLDRLVSEADIRTYHEDGAVCLRGLLSREWLDVLAEGFALAEGTPSPYAKNYGKPGEPRYYTDHKLFSRFEPFRRFVFDGPLARAAAEIMGSSRVDLYDEHLLIKEPGTTAPTYWHHDMPYFSITGYDLASAWFSLDPVTEDSGAVRFAVGSHKWGKLYQPVKIGLNEPVESFNREDLIRHVPDIDADPERYPTVMFEVVPGDVIFFHGLTLHASGANRRKDRNRRALSLRFAGDDIRWKNKSDAPLIFDHVLEDGEPLSRMADECPCLWPRAAAA